VLAQRTTTPSPDHSNAQAATTWPIANSGPSGTPPLQGPRVQSFATEVLPGAMKPLTWSGLAGHYLFESGTPPVHSGPHGPVRDTGGYHRAVGRRRWPCLPGVTYNADVPLLFSEIDRFRTTPSPPRSPVGFTETRCGPASRTNAAIRFGQLSHVLSAA